MVRTVCLGEEKHAVTVLGNLKEMKHEEELCDFIIKVQGQEFHTHRNVLFANSRYFKAMLKHETKDSLERKVEMKDVDAECVKNCIDFMYSGKFDIPDGKTRKFLHVAILMQLDDVTEAICHILIEDLNAANFYETKDIANIYNLHALSAKCMKYHDENFMAISAQPGFAIESKSHLLMNFTSGKLRLSAEDQLRVLFRWVGEDATKAEQNVFEMISHIDLKEISPEYLNELLESNPFVHNDLRLYRLISSALIENMTKVNESMSGLSSLASAALRHGDSETNKQAMNKVTDEPEESRETLVLLKYDEDCLLSFDPARNKVRKFHNESFWYRWPLSAVSLNEYIYILCDNKSVYRLDFKDRCSTWKRLKDMIHGHGTCPPAVSLSGCLFVIGSYGMGVNRRVAEKFDPVENEWMRLTNPPERFLDHALVSLNESVYAIGGRRDRAASNRVFQYTPSLSGWMEWDWVELEPMNKARFCCGAVATKQRVFVIAGYGDIGRTVDQIECYDVTSRQWTLLSPMLENPGSTFSHCINGWIFAFPRHYRRTIPKYDIANNRWCYVTAEGINECKVASCVLVNQ